MSFRPLSAFSQPPDMVRASSLIAPDEGQAPYQLTLRWLLERLIDENYSLPAATS